MKTTTSLAYTLLFVSFTFFLCQYSFAQWSPIGNYPGGDAYSVSSFVIDEKAYAGGGNPSLSSFFEYDITSDTWTPKGNIGGGFNRASAIRFAINGKGYVGAGSDMGSGIGPSFYEYDPTNDTWTQKADFPGGERHSGFYTAVNGKGYVICGSANGSLQEDVWEYDPANDSWTQKANFPGGITYWPAGFVIRDKIYVGTGSSAGVGLKEFYEYDPATDTWTQKADYPGTVRSSGVGFAVGLRGYIGAGLSTDFSVNFANFFEYDPDADTWTLDNNLDFPISNSAWTMAFVVGNQVVIGTGAASNGGIFPTSNLYKITLNNPTGIEENASNNQQNLKLYPNPSKESLFLSYDLPKTSMVELTISNLQGQVINTLSLGNKNSGKNQDLIPVSDLSNGLYLLTLFSDGHSQSQRFSVIH